MTTTNTPAPASDEGLPEPVGYLNQWGGFSRHRVNIPGVEDIPLYPHRVLRAAIAAKDAELAALSASVSKWKQAWEEAIELARDKELELSALRPAPTQGGV